MNEYIITLHEHEDLESFYHDMENEGGALHIPGRCTSCVNRRPVSRNTHYMLSEEEAKDLLEDPRVQSVTLTARQLGLEVRPLFEQTSNDWSKDNFNNSLHRNWGLLRCFEGENRSGWGTNGTPSQSGTVNIPAEGRNVDVVIVDGHFFPNHPEFLDENGVSRFVPYNWFALNPTVNPSDGRTNYQYTPVVDGGNPARTADNNHGAHVAGTACGRKQGWARSANIYNLNLYQSSNNPIDAEILFDYIRVFHANKPINPATGRKNPTIVNNSWGLAFPAVTSDILSINYRGSNINGPFSDAQLRDYGIMAGVQQAGIAVIPARLPAVDADVEDAIQEGIIMIGAAGNESVRVDVPGGQDYLNRLDLSIGSLFYQQGASPGSSPGMISVGAVGVGTSEAKATFSNCGPRVDVYAPGTNIISSLNSGGTTDSDDPTFRTGKTSGTSMASPQVCGLLACVLESYPRWTQAQALEYLIATCGVNQMFDSGGGYTDFLSLQGAPNRYLAYRAERTPDGATFPRRNRFLRPPDGAVYPRTNIRR